MTSVSIFSGLKNPDVVSSCSCKLINLLFFHSLLLSYCLTHFRLLQVDYICIRNYVKHILPSFLIITLEDLKQACLCGDLINTIYMIIQLVYCKLSHNLWAS